MQHGIGLITRAFFFLSVFLLLNLQADGPREDREIKLLVLITASDDLPVYEKEQQIWRSYMHLDPLHIQAFFMKANPDLPSACEIQGDIIWCRTADTLLPGVLIKTISSLELLSSGINGFDFDYVLRTNLSSFYFFPLLLEFLKTLPKSGCYCARPGQLGHDGKGEINFGSGAGFILSKDLAQMLVQAKSELLVSNEYDDVTIGAFFHSNNIGLIPAENIEFNSLDLWLDAKDRIPVDIFHFRCKNNNPDLRISHEVYILDELLNRFYPR